jgi:hypothetical protein
MHSQRKITLMSSFGLVAVGLITGFVLGAVYVSQVRKHQLICQSPNAPPEMDHVVLTEADLLKDLDVKGSGCEPGDEGQFKEVTVISSGLDDLSEKPGPPPEFLLMGENCVRLKYSINDDISNAARSWFPYYMTPGRRLKIKYYICGSGGYRTITHIEPLKALK